MRYNNIVEGKFLSRPNRFIANVEINGKTETVHVKNTGRCRELLVPNTTVFLEKSNNPLRKTQYDLIAVYKETLLINMDSQIPNHVAEEWLKLGDIFSKDAKIRREVKYKNSRFDFFIEDGKRKIFLEVKGCTLEQDGTALFPDAPTKRGVKHIEELISCINEGFEAYILFVIQMKGPKIFKPNNNTHKKFGDTLRKAKKLGVNILAYDCTVTPNSINIDKEVPIKL
ncbi:MAG: DNA/RNA nuclease SfsA [Clostridia bacterium]|nr:DNA/RNA nuclease SfsA [Clostridia bacterium]